MNILSASIEETPTSITFIFIVDEFAGMGDLKPLYEPADSPTRVGLVAKAS